MAKKRSQKKSSANAAKPAPASTPAIDDVPVTAALELGRSKVTLGEALQMAKNSVLELDRKINDPVDVVINGKLIARGEVVTASGNFGVRITEIVASQ